ncbi:hypothetical protein [Gellertiella hungarica]|uniref:Uncharacterized protein n=1 Tax=Gellertiella hungarica TaxID=1572859 RepID=A0A7W6J5X7_9HYPH|nr:hypothetical protein [Gellertiella hungarica]MBB4065354.1 hypothetical protein [Gellertiella hungarica]
MFYFGGMTLGYLNPPAREGGPEDGRKKAMVGSQAVSDGQAAERLPAQRELIARANWFSLYW